MSVHPISGGWIVRWRQGKKQPSRKFNRVDGFTREDAERFDHSMKRRKRMGGVDPLAAEREFGQVVDEWWASHHLDLADRTRDNQRSYLEHRLLPRFDGYRLCDITPPEVESFRVEMVEDGTGEATQRKVIYVLSGVFTYAQRMGYVVANPVQPIKKPGAYRQRLIQPFPPERVEKLRGWFLKRGDIEGATMVSVLAYAGPRPEEAHDRLTWADVGQSTIIFRGDKNEKDRATRLLEPLAQDLREWRQQSGVLVGQVFGWSHSRFNNWRGKGGWRHAVDELDLTLAGSRARPYDLRHAFATLLAGEGKGVDRIATELGHSVATCERWYRHLVTDIEDPQDASERILAARNVPQEFSDPAEADSL